MAIAPMTLPVGPSLRVAIVGCGQIADAHLQELGKIESVDVVATCDTHLDLAMQAALRFDVPRYYNDLNLMISAEKPDIVHIATPAHTHAALAQQCMIGGAHVYIEKPIAIDEREVRDVLATARVHSRVVCPGHDQLFDPAWVALRQRVEAGEIGEVRHVEAILGYTMSGQFGSAVRADARHWVRRLPGGLFQNTISHPIYRITEFLTDERPAIVANWWKKPGIDVPTEMFVHLRGQSVTGILTFATTIAAQRITRVYGTRGALEVDLDSQSVVRIAASALPGAFAKIDAPWRRKREASRAFRSNVLRFLRSDIHYFAGMRTLFERFQDAVRNPNAPWPVSGQEMLRVTRLMDDIFAACTKAERDGANATLAEREHYAPVTELYQSSSGKA
jgi:predicted dehydrogenase